MLSYLADFEHYLGPLRLFRFLTFRMFFAACTALVLGFIIAPFLLKWLRRLRFSQSLRDASEVGQLAELHAMKKNTPTMGGLIIYISLMVSVLLWARPNVYVLTALLVYSVLTAVGFIDDYLKVVHRNSKGLSSRWKLLTQAILTLAVVFLLLWDADVQYHMSQLWVPFYKVAIVHEMPLWFAIIFFFLVMAGSSNAINLTDGVDGLAIGCTISVALTFMVLSYCAGNHIISDYL